MARKILIPLASDPNAAAGRRDWSCTVCTAPLPPLTEVALAASALAELRHGKCNVEVETLKRLLRQG